MTHPCPRCGDYCACNTWESRSYPPRMTQVCIHCPGINQATAQEHDQHARLQAIAKRGAELICGELDKAERNAHPDRFAAAAKETVALIRKVKA